MLSDEYPYISFSLSPTVGNTIKPVILHSNTQVSTFVVDITVLQWKIQKETMTQEKEKKKILQIKISKK